MNSASELLGANMAVIHAAKLLIDAQTATTAAERLLSAAMTAVTAAATQLSAVQASATKDASLIASEHASGAAAGGFISAVATAAESPSPFAVLSAQSVLMGNVLVMRNHATSVEQHGPDAAAAAVTVSETVPHSPPQHLKRQRTDAGDALHAAAAPVASAHSATAAVHDGSAGSASSDVPVVCQWAAFTTANAQQHQLAAASSAPLTRTPSQRMRKVTRLSGEQQYEPAASAAAAAVRSAHCAAVAGDSASCSESLITSESSGVPLATVQQPRMLQRESGRLKVPKSDERWVCVGVWVASRDFPAVPFFVQFVDQDTGLRLEQEVGYQGTMALLSPKYNDRQRILLHTRVAQRVDGKGKPFGEVRYVCTDIAVSYEMGDNAFQWIAHQLAHSSAQQHAAVV